MHTNIEIVKDVERNGDCWIELLLENTPLQENCLSRALIAAVMCDNPSNVGTLVTKGASNITEALQLAVKECKHSAHAMLLLMMAAIKNDCDLVQKLFSEQETDANFHEVQKTLGNVSTLLPLEMACRRQNKNVVEELLLRTDAYQSEGSVYWHGFGLDVIENTLLSKIRWVRKLNLGHNRLKALPSEVNLHLQNVGTCKQLCKL